MKSVQERLMEAMVEVVVERGYNGATVEEVLERAGVEQLEFERLFSSKQECALTAMEEIGEEFKALGREAYAREAQWPNSLRAAAYAMAYWIQENPKKARFGAVEMLWAGELAQAQREAGFQSLADLVDAGRERAENPDAIPTNTAESVIGSIGEMITKNLQTQDLDLMELVRELMYVSVRPYIGEEAAADELRMPPSPRSATATNGN